MENNQKEQTYYHGSESIKRQVAFALGGAPVSYTHLDVYKRQDLL